jgi:S1-C subfamily serine protease
MLGRAGVPAGAVITAIDGEPIEDLDALQRALEARAGQQRMIVRYHTLADPRRDQVTVAIMDRLWFPMQRCVRDDTTGTWPCTPAGEPPAVAMRTQVETVPLTSADPVGRKLAPALVLVEFDIPHPTAGAKSFNYVGAGVIVDAERGWVLVDRDTVPVALGDIDIVFAGSLRLPGRLLYLHPVHNIAVLKYEPALLGDTPVGQVTFVDTPLQTGDAVWQVGLDRNFGVVSNRTRVERVEPLSLGISATPRYRDYNVDGVDLVNIAPSLGGVLTDRRGRVLALWASFVDRREDDRRFRGLPTSLLPRAVVERNGVLGPYCATGAEVFPINLADAQDRGLSVGRSRALVQHDPIGRRVLEVRRVMGGSNAQAAGLRSGDLLLEARVANDARIITTMAELEALNRAACGDTSADLTVLRDGEEVVLSFSATPLDGHGTDRAVSWAGLLVHEPHVEVALQQGIAREGVYVTWLWYGSPGSRYGLRPTRRITEVDDTPTPDLDAFIEAVSQHRDRQSVRLKMVSLDGQVGVYTLKLDQHYWPMYVVERGEDGVWTRR